MQTQNPFWQFIFTSNVWYTKYKKNVFDTKKHAVQKLENIRRHIGLFCWRRHVSIPQLQLAGFTVQTQIFTRTRYLFNIFILFLRHKGNLWTEHKLYQWIQVKKKHKRFLSPNYYVLRFGAILFIRFFSYSYKK